MNKWQKLVKLKRIIFSNHKKNNINYSLSCLKSSFTNNIKIINNTQTYHSDLITNFIPIENQAKSCYTIRIIKNDNLVNKIISYKRARGFQKINKSNFSRKEYIQSRKMNNLNKPKVSKLKKVDESTKLKILSHAMKGKYLIYKFSPNDEYESQNKIKKINKVLALADYIYATFNPEKLIHAVKYILNKNVIKDEQSNKANTQNTLINQEIEEKKIKNKPAFDMKIQKYHFIFSNKNFNSFSNVGKISTTIGRKKNLLGFYKALRHNRLIKIAVVLLFLYITIVKFRILRFTLTKVFYKYSSEPTRVIYELYFGSKLNNYVNGIITEVLLDEEIQREGSKYILDLFEDQLFIKCIADFTNHLIDKIVAEEKITESLFSRLIIALKSERLEEETKNFLIQTAHDPNIKDHFIKLIAYYLHRKETEEAVRWFILNGTRDILYDPDLRPNLTNLTLEIFLSNILRRRYFQKFYKHFMNDYPDEKSLERVLELIKDEEYIIPSDFKKNINLKERDENIIRARLLAENEKILNNQANAKVTDDENININNKSITNNNKTNITPNSNSNKKNDEKFESKNRLYKQRRYNFLKNKNSDKEKNKNNSDTSNNIAKNNNNLNEEYNETEQEEEYDLTEIFFNGNIDADFLINNLHQKKKKKKEEKKIKNYPGFEQLYTNYEKNLMEKSFFEIFDSPKIKYDELYAYNNYYMDGYLSEENPNKTREKVIELSKIFNNVKYKDIEINVYTGEFVDYGTFLDHKYFKLMFDKKMLRKKVFEEIHRNDQIVFNKFLKENNLYEEYNKLKNFEGYVYHTTKPLNSDLYRVDFSTDFYNVMVIDKLGYYRYKANFFESTSLTPLDINKDKYEKVSFIKQLFEKNKQFKYKNFIEYDLTDEIKKEKELNLVSFKNAEEIDLLLGKYSKYNKKTKEERLDERSKILRKLIILDDDIKENSQMK